MNYDLSYSEDMVQRSYFRPLYFLALSTYSQLRPSRLVGQYFSKAIFPRELYWSQLRSCNRAT